MKSSPKNLLFLLFLFFQSQFTGAQPVIINELLASNSQGIVTVFGEHSDWIELYNPGTGSANLSGYFLTDEKDSLTKWKFPPNTLLNGGSYLLIYADGRNTGLHTNFKLSKSGEFIALVKPDSTLADSLTFDKQADDISFGRIPPKSENWGYFPVPTPGKINSSSSSLGLLPEPVFSIQGGFFDGPLQVTFSLSAEADIYYTLDGSEPTPASNLYTGPLSITKTTAIRVCAIKAGFISSPVKTNTYFINETTTLPVISLVTNPENLFDNRIGIYVTGTNGIAGACDPTPRNLNQDWERPVNVEFYEPTGEQGLNQEAGIKIFGGCSRTRYPQKSFALFARKDYGKGSFDYPIFPDRSFQSYESFLLRSSSDDQVFTLFRDALSHSVLPEFMDAEVQAYRPALVFINGIYWGIHNLREKIDEHYFSNHFGVNPDQINILEGQGWATVGSAASYSALVTFTDQKNMALKANYDYIKTQMDVDQYIDYMIGHIYLAERDWPGNNIKFWKANSGDYAKWRWINFDMDQCFTLIWLNEDMIAKTTQANGPGWPNPDWSTKLFRNLLKNTDFKNEFIQRYAWHTNVTFNPERLISFIDHFEARLEPEIPRHIQKWGGKIDPDSQEGWQKPTFSSVSEWKSNVEEMRTFAKNRAAFSSSHILRKFGLSGLSQLTLQNNATGNGLLQITGRTVPDGFNGTFFNDIPVKISAVPFYGKTFSHWELKTQGSTQKNLITTGSVWNYFDKGRLPAGNWFSAEFNDSDWSSGKTQFGYGEDDEATKISFGPDSQNKYMTTYFRTSFIIDSVQTVKTVTLDLMADDGAVLYLNGTEVIRENMPAGVILYSTPAIQYSASENTFNSYQLSPEKLIRGMNCLAAEIHQSDGASSDLSFDLKLTVTLSNGQTAVTYLTPDISIVPKGDGELTAFFETENTGFDYPVVINEINYKSAPGADASDWIELVNAGKRAIDLKNFKFSDLNEVTGFPIQKKTLLLPGDFLVLCADTVKFDALFPFGIKRTGNFTFGLSSDGEDLFIKDSKGREIDKMRYGSTSPWPDANGTGLTLELTNPFLDNNDPSSWLLSKSVNGTPGLPNSRLVTETEENKRVKEKAFALFQNFPNPFNPVTTLSYQLATPGFTELSIYNLLGQELSKPVSENQREGRYSVSWDAGNFASGVYICRLKSGTFSSTRRMILLK